MSYNLQKIAKIEKNQLRVDNLVDTGFCKMLQNAYLLAKIGADTAENEQHFAETLPKIGNYPTGPSGPPSGLRQGGGPWRVLAQRWGQPRHVDTGRGAERPARLRGAASSAVRAPPAARGSHQRRDLGKFRKNVARFRLYRHRFLQVNS